MSEATSLLLVCLAVLFIGISKAGFGGGLGLLTTPLCVLAFSATGKPPTFAIGVLLPLLSLGDVFSLWHYWRKWDARNLKYLLPGAIVGIVLGVQWIGLFSARQLNVAIGILAVSFVTFQLVKAWVFRAEGTFAPNHYVGMPAGVVAGITSTFAHGAGPLIAIFLIPQRLPKQVYVATTVLIFTWINWIKLPFFAARGIINGETLRFDLWCVPLVPVGVWIGVWLNRRFSEQGFLRVVYLLAFLAGLQLIFEFDWTRLFR